MTRQTQSKLLRNGSSKTYQLRMTMKRESYKLECVESKKVKFDSEASAHRRLNKYEDIERVYYCKYCDGYHLTSRPMEETDIQYPSNYIEARLKKLENEFWGKEK
jgi:hypothetical protein